MNYRIEALLSARLFLRPEVVGDRIYFISNISGHNSLYVMDHGGSVPEPLLPPDIVLQNPHLIGGASFAVLKDLGKIFTAYYRSQHALSEKGDGIGLYLVKENIEQIGGYVNVDSKVENGSTFTIDIPIKLEQE